jgi:hypothetical protein
MIPPHAKTPQQMASPVQPESSTPKNAGSTPVSTGSPRQATPNSATIQAQARAADEKLVDQGHWREQAQQTVKTAMQRQPQQWAEDRPPTVRLDSDSSAQAQQERQQPLHGEETSRNLVAKGSAGDLPPQEAYSGRSSDGSTIAEILNEGPSGLSEPAVPKSDETFNIALNYCFWEPCASQNKAFKRKADLDRHIAAIHTRVAAMIDCEHPGCHRRSEYGFVRRDRMIEHMRDVHKASISKRGRKDP